MIKNFNKPSEKHQMSPGHRHTNTSKIHSWIHPSISEKKHSETKQGFKTQDRHIGTVYSLLYFITVPFHNTPSFKCIILLSLQIPLPFYAFINSFIWNASLCSSDTLLFIFSDSTCFVKLPLITAVFPQINSYLFPCSYLILFSSVSL